MTTRSGSSAGRRPNDDRKRWLDHRHYRTYEIALRLTRAVGPSADLRDLEFLMEHITDFLAPWQKESAVHKFARVIADEMFIDDTAGPYVKIYEKADEGSVRMRRYLPVDVALHAYGIDTEQMFSVPEPDGTEVREGNIIRWEESSKVADACYDYTLDLQLTAVYDGLVAQLADEVFHTIFPNRVLLSRLHEILAIYVRQQDPEPEHDLARLFSREGRLKRVTPPRWARDAVFFRDRGHCAACGADLTRLINALPEIQFDHIVPLDLGGLNDVTNLQLLCQPCNRDKSARPVQPSGKHQRYYEPRP